MAPSSPVTPPPPAPISTSGAFRVELALALDAQRRQVVAAGAAVRLAAALLFLALCTLLWGLGGEDWAPYVLPLAAYALLVGAVFALRRRPFAARLGVVQSPLDAALVFALQQLALPVSPHPAGVAGFTLGLMALVVALGALTMSPVTTYATAALATLLQGVLMREAGVGWGALAVVPVVLGVVAAVGHYGSGRLHTMALALTRAEVERQVEARRFQEVEEARGVIEEMLGAAQAQNAALQALQRDKEQLTQFLVHDLRSPLSALTLNLSWLQPTLEQAGRPELARAAEDGLAVADRLAGMISDLLDVPRLEEGRLELRATPVRARDLLARLRPTLAAPAARQGVQLELEAPDGLALAVDPALLTRVLENLAVNAVRHTPRGGRLRLEAGTDAAGPFLAVRNDGTPIAPEARAGLFEKYGQGERERTARHGYGLGLYFSRLAVQAHGGSLGVEDAPGWATSFVARLPPARTVTA